ncbi:MAG: hypothetical protein ACLP1D_08235 [Xanthobacteraceae bacterium]
MPTAKIQSKQAILTLTQLHAELAGKLRANQNQAAQFRISMVQVEAVLRMLQPGFDVTKIAAKRRNKSNPWFKRGTLFRSAVDTLRRAQAPMTARQITETLIAGKGVMATSKQVRDLQAAIQTSLRNHKGGTVEAVGEGFPIRWRLSSGDRD